MAGVSVGYNLPWEAVMKSILPWYRHVTSHPNHRIPGYNNGTVSLRSSPLSTPDMRAYLPALHTW